MKAKKKRENKNGDPRRNIPNPTMSCALKFAHLSVLLHRFPSLGQHGSQTRPSLLPPGSSRLSNRWNSVRDSIRNRRSGARHRFNGDGSAESDEIISFEHAVSLFNSGDYYRCHDLLEELWYEAEEPTRTILHGILQCAVGFHHLFNQNHRGAMLQLGEGLCKLRKMRFESGPFLRFEQEVSEALEFIYQTQLELAACTDDLCITMDGSETSYRLLGSFAAGQKLYQINHSPEGLPVIIFTSDKPSMVKVPTLDANEEHLEAFLYRS